jgi:lipoprotein-anchoring transpeptidase ErfK/SrfK
MNPNGYNYVLVEQHSGQSAPETLTVWHTGAVVAHSLANTGIATRATQLGTYPVYLRYRTQIMRGTNPDGTPYADPVQYVAYFYTSDAVHYFPRSTYGWRQSLGCVELPLTAAALVWNYTTYGTLVTVTPN